MKIAIWKLSLIGVLLNSIFSFLPIAPFMCFIGGFVAAHYFYRYEFIYLQQKPSKADCFYLVLISSSLSGFLIAYLFILFFFYSLGKPLEESWLQIEFVENLLRKSKEFKWFFFLSSFTFSALTNAFGCFLAFKLGISKKTPNTESLLEKLELKDLLKYLD